jgi:acetoin utilization deacetylase AcuC-like enzyme
LANTSISASYLVEKGFEPAILDIDYHHGNGAQEIWYESDQVLTVSLYRYPAGKFPYYSGLESEKGLEKGLTWNQNYCFAKDTR